MGYWNMYTDYQEKSHYEYTDYQEESHYGLLEHVHGLKVMGY